MAAALDMVSPSSDQEGRRRLMLALSAPSDQEACKRFCTEVVHNAQRWGPPEQQFLFQHLPVVMNRLYSWLSDKSQSSDMTEEAILRTFHPTDGPLCTQLSTWGAPAFLFPMHRLPPIVMRAATLSATDWFSARYAPGDKLSLNRGSAWFELLGSSRLSRSPSAGLEGISLTAQEFLLTCFIHYLVCDARQFPRSQTAAGRTGVLGGFGAGAGAGSIGPMGGIMGAGQMGQQVGSISNTFERLLLAHLDVFLPHSAYEIVQAQEPRLSRFFLFLLHEFLLAPQAPDKTVADNIANDDGRFRPGSLHAARLIALHVLSNPALKSSCEEYGFSDGDTSRTWRGGHTKGAPKRLTRELMVLGPGFVDLISALLLGPASKKQLDLQTFTSLTRLWLVFLQPWKANRLYAFYRTSRNPKPVYNQQPARLGVNQPTGTQPIRRCVDVRLLGLEPDSAPHARATQALPLAPEDYEMPMASRIDEVGRALTSVVASSPQASAATSPRVAPAIGAARDVLVSCSQNRVYSGRYTPLEQKSMGRTIYQNLFTGKVLYFYAKPGERGSWRIGTLSKSVIHATSDAQNPWDVPDASWTFNHSPKRDAGLTVRVDNKRKKEEDKVFAALVSFRVERLSLSEMEANMRHNLLHSIIWQVTDAVAREAGHGVHCDHVVVERRENAKEGSTTFVATVLSAAETRESVLAALRVSALGEQLCMRGLAPAQGSLTVKAFDRNQEQFNRRLAISSAIRLVPGAGDAQTWRSYVASFYGAYCLMETFLSSPSNVELCLELSRRFIRWEDPLPISSQPSLNQPHHIAAMKVLAHTLLCFTDSTLLRVLADLEQHERQRGSAVSNSENTPIFVDGDLHAKVVSAASLAWAGLLVYKDISDDRYEFLPLLSNISVQLSESSAWMPYGLPSLDNVAAHPSFVQDVYRRFRPPSASSTPVVAAAPMVPGFVGSEWQRPRRGGEVEILLLITYWLAMLLDWLLGRQSKSVVSFNTPEAQWPVVPQTEWPRLFANWKLTCTSVFMLLLAVLW